MAQRPPPTRMNSAPLPRRARKPAMSLGSSDLPSSSRMTRRGSINLTSTSNPKKTLTNPAPKTTRTSKTSQKLVVLPSEPQKKPLYDDDDVFALQTTTYEGTDRELDGRSEAERMSKEQRHQAGYQRLTAYCVAESINSKLTTAFLKREHGVKPRVYDDAIYVRYQLPLLPGYVPGINVRTSVITKGSREADELVNLTEAEELGYEGTYFSGAEGDHNEPVHRTHHHSQDDMVVEYGHEPTHNLEHNGFLASSPTAIGPSDTEGFISSAFGDLSFSPPNHNDNELAIPIPTPASLSPHTELPTPNSPTPPSALETTTPTPTPVPAPAPTSASTLALPKSDRRKRRAKHKEDDDEEDTSHNTAEAIIFTYGVVVFFGLPEAHERAILEDLDNARVLLRKFDEAEWEVEECHFEHDETASKPRIYNDFFTLKSRSHLLKLSISHALAQSTLLARFETLTLSSLSSPTTLSIPRQLAVSGSIQLRRREAMALTGRLFRLRRDVNLVSNVMDTPELFWSEASLKELYDAVRDYMEIGERVEGLNKKLEVVKDLLEMIHEHLNGNAMVRITWIIIWLIVVAIVVELGEALARVVVHAATSGPGYRPAYTTPHLWILRPKSTSRGFNSIQAGKSSNSNTGASGPAQVVFTTSESEREKKERENDIPQFTTIPSLEIREIERKLPEVMTREQVVRLLERIRVGGAESGVMAGSL